ncbi:hypothetical protein VTJ83DRAFT_1183 [Remersonia thermophila]|uniref:Uncharacterized protein n=1 Tax=Remersonia thermophila TaxID=72144 RepID=A0ABR4DNK1_9PEZI
MFLTRASNTAARAAGARTWLPLLANGGAALRGQQCFSTSPARQGNHIITFRPSSTPELDQLLEDFRHKIILPTYLSPEQRRRIYNPRQKQSLINDPVTMEIDGVIHRFRYVDQVRDLPSTTKTLAAAIKMMRSEDDFRNVRPLLEGARRAGRKLNHPLIGSLIRRAAEHDALDVVLECAKAADKTGIKLDRSEYIAQLLVWLQWPAIRSGFAADETKAALRRVGRVVDLLEEDEEVHRPDLATRGAFPFYRDPQVLAMRLHMAAARAVHHRKGKDDSEGNVSKWAAELMALWPEGKGLLDLQPDEAYRDKNKLEYMLDRSQYLWVASPVLHGLTLAAQVVDPALTMQLQNRADKVEEEVQAALASDKLSAKGRGRAMYDALFRREQGQEEASE